MEPWTTWSRIPGSSLATRSGAGLASRTSTSVSSASKSRGTALRTPLPPRTRLVALRDLRDAAGDFRLATAMIGLALAVPIASAFGIRALSYWGGGVNAVVERLTVVGGFFVVF